MADFMQKVTGFAIANPVKFVALSMFSLLGGLPIAGFLIYAVATVIASLVGAVILELILLAVGITALAFILFSVSCITICVTSVFVAMYYSYQVVSGTWRRKSFDWASRKSVTELLNTDSAVSNSADSGTEQAEEEVTFDKTK